MDASLVAALLSLPNLPRDSALVAAAVFFLLAVIVAARTVIAWQGLASMAAGAGRRRERVERIEAGVHAELGDLRRDVQELNAGVERALWWLPRFDAQLGEVKAQLRGSRAAIEHLDRDEGRALRATFARIRGTLNVLRGMRELRRTILG